EIDGKSYIEAKEWVAEITEKSVVVSEDWLSQYIEGKPPTNKNSSKVPTSSIASLDLPMPTGAKAQVKERREQISTHQQFKSKLN
ncbi:MAG: hypothetical protein V7735_24515, partial [Photobacterium frigidiphilum]|uniref:hypothetical protein n=1 Tax=Photobacterium frigidiphilum TaxID=264736 RepID=UPI0030017833